MCIEAEGLGRLPFMATVPASTSACRLAISSCRATCLALSLSCFHAANCSAVKPGPRAPASCFSSGRSSPGMLQQDGMLS